MLLDLMRKEKGLISIFLCLIMLPMVTYTTMIIDASRLQSARVVVASAGDLTMNSALSEYEQVLEDMYGLFAVAKTPEQLENALTAYYSQTIESTLKESGTEDQYVQGMAQELTDLVMSGNTTPDDVDNFLQLKLEEFNYEAVEGANLGNPAILKRQIIDYMKYKGPISIVSTIFNKLDFLKDSSKQTEVLEQKVTYTEKLNGLSDPCKKAYKDIEGDSNNPDDCYNAYIKKYNDYQQDIDTLMMILEANLTCMAKCDLMYRNSPFKNKQWSYDGLLANAQSRNTNIDVIRSMSMNSLSDAENRLNKIEEEFRKIADYNINSNSVLNWSDTVNVNVTGKGTSSDPSVSVNLSPGSTEAYLPSLATLSGTDSWIDALDAKFGVPEETLDSLGRKFDMQKELIGYEQNISEFLGKYEDLKELRSLYDETFSTYTEEFKNSLDSDEDTAQALLEDEIKNDGSVYSYHFIQHKFADAFTDEVQNTYQSKLDDLITKANDISVYSDGSKFFASNATDHFFEYYGYINNALNKINQFIAHLDEVINAMGAVETAKADWKASVDGLGGDTATGASMKSDYETQTEAFKKEDVEAMKAVAIEARDRLEALYDMLWSVKYMSTAIVTAAPNTPSYINNTGYDKYIVESYADIKSTVENSVMLSDYDGKGVDMDKFIDENIIDGKLYSSGNNSQTEEDERERFYYTLKQIADPPKGSTLKTEEQAAYDNTTSYAQVNADGTPTSTPVEPSSGSGSSGGSTSEQDNIKVGDIMKKINNGNLAAEENKSTVSGVSVNSDGEVSGNPALELSVATSLLDNFTRLAENARDHAYVEEYLTEMFTCQTDKKQEELTLLNGYSNDENAARSLNINANWYGKEIEFILWGDENLDASVGKTEAMIFTIRFACNAIYAFTASDIQSFALQVATAIAGWTVVGVPIVQAAITIGLALAESAVDLAQLKDGKDVPIFKNVNTFICSPYGALANAGEKVITEVTKKVGETVEGAFDSALDSLVVTGNEKIGDVIDKVDEQIVRFVEEQREQIKTTIHNQFITPIVNQMTPLIGMANQSAQRVSEAVDTALNTIKANISAMNDGLIKDLALQFYNSKESDIRKELNDAIAVFDSDGNNIKEMFTDIIDGKINDFSDIIDAKLKTYEEQFKQKIKESSGEAATELKSKFHEGMNDFTAEIGGGSSGAESSSVLTTNDTNGSSGGITLNYKEYCKIFVLINLISDEKEDKMLKRAAALIEANVNAKNKNNDFDIVSSPTLVSVSAKVKMGTLFDWNVQDNQNDVEGSSEIQPDFSELGDNEVTINYTGVFGY